MAGGARALMRIERRSCDAALAAGRRAARLDRRRARASRAIVLLATGHNPLHAYRRLFEAAFTDPGALSSTLVAGDAALLHRPRRPRSRSASGSSTSAPRASSTWARSPPRARRSRWPARASRRRSPRWSSPAASRGAAWALIPGFLRAFANTNEIITSLMLNYVAGALPQLPDLRHALVLARHVVARRRAVPAGQGAARCRLLADVRPRHEPRDPVRPARRASSLAGVVAVLYARTRFGFEAAVIGDSPRAARYAGMRTRRNILLVMALSGLLAGVGGASQDGDFRHLLDPRGLQQPGYGYTGIVVAALARYNPFAVVLVAFLIGGLSNAGYALQGADFPPGLVGVMQGIVLFCALGGELLVRYRVRLGRRRRRGAPAAGRVNNSLSRPDRVVGDRLRHAAAVRRARRAAGRALRRAQPRRRGDDARRRRDGVLRRAAPRRAGPLALCRARSPSPRSPARASRCIHAFLVITLRASQIVSGLALTIFAGAAGLSSYLANDLDLARRRRRATRSGRSCRSRSSDLPVVGPLLFAQTALVYASWVLTALVALYLSRTRPGPRAARRRRGAGRGRRGGHQRDAPTATRTRSSAARSPASAAPASASRSRRSGWTG